MRNTKALKAVARVATKSAEKMSTKASPGWWFYQPRMPKSLVK